MSARDQHGISAALGAAIDQAEAAGEAVPGAISAGEAEIQREMFADRPLLGELMQLEDGSKAPRSGPGRPPGSKNRRTEEWVGFILARHRSPLLGLAEVVSTPIPQLARDLGMPVAEAAEFWRKCAAELAPYLHQRQPLAVDLKGANAGMLVVQIGAALGASGPERSAFGLDLKPMENQGVVDEPAQVSESGNSEGEAK